MCGLVGAIGKPHNKIKSYALMTNLLRETKRRGRHATGFYAVNLEGKSLFGKEGISADSYVKKREWKQMIHGFKAMIGHARFTTQGSATDNVNNHPHLSKNENIALVHNGIIHNYDDEKAKYANSLISECDSELVLRMICREKDVVSGIKKVFADLGTGGDFACELLHRRKDGGATFYFFRDDGRPGRLIDARKELGQFIFCSETDIWKDAVLKSGMSRLVRQLDVINIDPYTIIAIDADTLKSNLITVEKPNKIKHYRGRVPQVYREWDEADAYATNTNYVNGSTIITPDIDDIADSNSNNTSVLDAHWIETKNDKGLPRFIFDPSVKIEVPLDESDTKIIEVEVEDEITIEDEYKKQLSKGLIDKSERYSGWEEDALESDVIDEELYYAIKNETNSEDALDNINDINIPTTSEILDIGDTLTVQSDNHLLDTLND